MNVNVFMFKYVCVRVLLGIICMYAYVCLRIALHNVCTYVYMYTCIWVCTCVSMHPYVYVCMWLCVLQYGPVWWDPDPFQEIQSCARYGPVAQAFWRPNHGMIQGSYQFVQWRPDGDSDPKPRHFMWVFILMSFPCSLWPVVFIYLFVLFHVNMWHILSVWLPYHFIWHQWPYTLCI